MFLVFIVVFAQLVATADHIDNLNVAIASELMSLLSFSRAFGN